MELECGRRVLRNAQKTGWHNDKEAFAQVVAALKLVTEAYLTEGTHCCFSCSVEAEFAGLQKHVHYV